MKEQDLFEKHKLEIIPLMSLTGFQSALKERDEYRKCRNCKSYFSQEQNNGHPHGCTNKDAYTIVDLTNEDETKFGCNYFEDKA